MRKFKGRFQAKSIIVLRQNKENGVQRKIKLLLCLWTTTNQYFVTKTGGKNQKFTHTFHISSKLERLANAEASTRR